MKRLVVLTIVFMCISGIVFADDSTAHDVILNVNEVCLIDLNSTATITLNTVAPAAGGMDPTGETDATKLLQYTSLVPSGQSRNITANWGGTDSAPAGTSLRLEVTSVPAGCGTAGAQITMSDTAQSIVTAIGSCATGIGANGAALLYTFSVDDVSQLVVGASETVTVTLTLTDAS
jgi:hypothetical protein